MSVAGAPAGAGDELARRAAGLNTLTIVLAHALGPAVRVNGVLPGMFRTEISRSRTAEITAKSETAALHRIAHPDEIVGAVRYLTSADSSSTTRAIIKVDGGLTWASG